MNAMFDVKTLIEEADYGTPASKSEKTVTLTIDGRTVTVPEGTSIMRAAMDAGRGDPEALRHRHARRLRLLPRLPGRDRRPRRHARLLHHAGRRRAGGEDADRPVEQHPPRRDGALRLRPSARLGRRGQQRRRRDAARSPTRSASPRSATGSTAATTSCRATASTNVDYMPKDESNPYFTYDASQCIVCSRCVRACEEVQGTFALTIAGRGFESRVAAGMSENFIDSECVSCGACVQACPTDALREKSVLQMGRPTHSVVTTCAYCGVGCSFKAEMRGDEVVRMVPWKDGKANRGHSCVKGRFAWGYSTHKDRILNPMIREKITDPWREVTWEEAFAHVAKRVPPHPVPVRPRRDRRHHLVALHQRGDLSRPEAGAAGLRQQQCRHLRARLPFADRLRPEDDLRHLGRHAGFRFGRSDRRRDDHRRQPDRRPSGVRLAAEEAAAARAPS